MLNRFIIDSSHIGCYLSEISGENNSPRSADSYLANLCGISIEEYRKVMLTKFNALPLSSWRPSIYFRKRKEVEKAIEWIESMIVMNKLQVGG